MPWKAGLAAKILVIVVFLCVGLNYLWTASRLLSSSPPSDSSRFFLQSFYNGDSYVGIIDVSLSPDPSFVVGANITADVKIGLPGAWNETYFIEIMFLNALVVRDAPPYTWQQDWTYLLRDTSQINGTEQIQTLNGVTLVYAEEGVYGLNMTITRASTNSKMYFHFNNLVQIKPLSYLEEEFRSNVTFALNYQILGLTLIMVAPVMVQLVDFIEKTFEKPPNRNPESTSTKGQTEGPKMSENRKTRRSKAADWLKIQIMADYYQAGFSFVSSIVISAFVGLFIVAITLRFENVLDMIGYLVFLVIVMVFFLFYAWRAFKNYHSDLEKIDDLFARVENGETLPSIAELRKKKKAK